LLDFSAGKGTRGALYQVPERKRADGHADQAENFDPLGLEHPADVAILAFIQDDFEPGVAAPLAKDGCALGAQELAVAGDTICERPEETVAGKGGNLDVVGLIQVRAGIGDAGGPLGIVSEQEQTFAGFVEAAYRREPAVFLAQRGGKKIVDGLAAFFVGGGGDDAARFVHHQIKFSGRPDGLAVDFDLVSAEMDGGFGITADGGVQAYSSGANQCHRAGAGAEAEFREGASQADTRGLPSVVFPCAASRWDFAWWAHLRSISAAGIASWPIGNLLVGN